MSEQEIKFILVVLFGLGALASAAGSEAVLPAYVAGLVIAGFAGLWAARRSAYRIHYRHR